MWRGRDGPTPGACAAAGQRGRAAAPPHVARQRLPAASYSQAQPKGSPGANKVRQGYF
jgi:hypothetical protein